MIGGESGVQVLGVPGRGVQGLRSDTGLLASRGIIPSKEVSMVFVLLSQVTEKGAATIKGRPERVKEVNREIEAFGVRVLHQYAVLGPYDFVTVVEAPDPASVARMSVELAARGTVRIQSLPAIPIDDFLAKFK